MDVTKPYHFIGFGAMDVAKPSEFIGFGATDVTKPYEFIGFAAMDVTKPYTFIGFGGVRGPGRNQKQIFMIASKKAATVRDSASGSEIWLPGRISAGF